MSKNKFTLGFSSCPNDTFMFDAMVHHKVDTLGLDFEVVIADVEQLNEMAFNNELDITKLSYFAIASLLDKYKLLSAGSALGNHCGPLLICKRNPDLINLSSALVAIPGKYTTANFLLDFYAPNVRKTEMIFSDIEEAVRNEVVDAGVIIHESRFTYHQRGLKLIADLGDHWENVTTLPIPLGGIAVRREIPVDTQLKINSVLKSSIEYAFSNPSSSKEYVKSYAMELEDDVIQKHIDLYVNKYSIDLGEKGKEAVNGLFKAAGKSSYTDKEIYV